MKEVKVVTTKIFIVGPRKTVSIKKGSVKTVSIDEKGRFWTIPDSGKGIFGECQLGNGWQEVKQ